MSAGGPCQVCGRPRRLLPAVLGVCAECIRARPDEALPLILRAHARVRTEFDLPARAPRTAGGVECPLCTNACRLGEGDCRERDLKQHRHTVTTWQRA